MAALAVVLLCALAVGCGSSSDAAPLTKSQFVKQGNAICDTMQTERATQTDEAEGELSGADEEETMSFALDPVETMIDELGELGPPKGQVKEVEAIIAAFEEGVAKVEAEPAGSKTVSAFEQANQKAAAYGLTSCSI